MNLARFIYSMIFLDILIAFNVHNYELKLTRHAFTRALGRGITPDILEATIYGGKIARFGKHGIKFARKYNTRTVVCVGLIEGTKLKILTVEVGK